MEAVPPTGSSGNLAKETEKFLHEQIPITRTMGVTVESCSEERLVLSAPLEVNHNHLGTAFGGSLASVAVLAGYSMLWVKLGNRNCHIVIRDSKVRYLHPVQGDIRAVCRMPEPATWSAFMKRFHERGKARIRLKVFIEEDGRSCVEFDGEYVAIA